MSPPRHHHHHRRRRRLKQNHDNDRHGSKRSTTKASTRSYNHDVLETPLSAIWTDPNANFSCQREFVWDNRIFTDSDDEKNNNSNTNSNSDDNDTRKENHPHGSTSLLEHNMKNDDNDNDDDDDTGGDRHGSSTLDPSNHPSKRIKMQRIQSQVHGNSMGRAKRHVVECPFLYL
jgi:hypothetical protein